MKRSILPFLLTLLAYGAAPAQAQTANTRVTTTVNVDIPVVVKLAGVDNITTVQSLNLNSRNILFDANLTASGRTFVTWRGNTNANSGFRVTVQRTAIIGNGPSALAEDIYVSGQSSRFLVIIILLAEYSGSKSIGFNYYRLKFVEEKIIFLSLFLMNVHPAAIVAQFAILFKVFVQPYPYLYII